MATLQRDTVTITRQTVVSDGAGGQMEQSTQTLYSGLAMVEPLKPRRALEADQVNLGLSVKVRFWRYGLPDIKAGDQLTWRSKQFAFGGPLLPLDASEREFVATAVEILPAS